MVMHSLPLGGSQKSNQAHLFFCLTELTCFPRRLKDQTCKVSSRRAGLDAAVTSSLHLALVGLHTRCLTLLPPLPQAACTHYRVQVMCSKGFCPLWVKVFPS